VNSAIETVRPLVDAGGHSLTVSLAEPPIFLDADLTRLAQVFGNLLTNSAKYTRKGGRIWLSSKRQGTEVAVIVRDTGKGIPREALPHIFDMFSQVGRDIEQSAEGLGIGLSLAKGLIELHHGTITAESEGEGRGSTFTVRLPMLMEEPLSLTGPAADMLDQATPARRILVVDDNRDAAISLGVMLKLMGNSVRTVHDGYEALEVAESFRPEIILMDVGMPALDGYETTRRIRQQPWGRDILIFALTGWAQEADRVKSQAAGCNGHLAKPVSVFDLEHGLAQMSQLALDPARRATEPRFSV
jgi:CheY-like chemotaxis protein